jgi:DNA-binding beta-propeller fold protein YncE
MNILNPIQKLAAPKRASFTTTLFLLAAWLATALPLRADRPPTYLFQIDASTVPGGFAPGVFEPFYMAFDSSNNVYVTDIYNCRVVKFTTGGLYLGQWGSPGTGNGQLETPTGIAVDSSNNVYVADYVPDSNSYRIKKFDGNGNYLTQWGSPGSGNGQFSSISGIAVDTSQNVYVADTYNSRVEKFTSNGTYLTQWGSIGTGNGHFSAPLGIALDSGNNVYVSDNGNGRIEKFASNGSYQEQWSCDVGGDSGIQPSGIAVSSSEDVYVSDGAGVVQKFGSSGAYLTQWGVYGSVISPNLQGVAVDNTGNYIYVADSSNYRIQVFANNTTIIPPFITSELTNQTIPAGINVTFSPGVTGGAPFAYQWNSNNVAIPGATNANFTLINVSLSDSGNYSVLVTNSYGSALSSNAVLIVLPSIVLTQPPSSLSITGAVLNGSITVGSDETVAWFEWGTDTNYGNIVDETILPGNSGSNNISAALSRLPGNIYHYRIDAANDFGIVYGNDQSFTVGLHPTATTLAAINSTNGATLNATVKPNGWDTMVYFKWGTFGGLFTNLTPTMDVGAGAAPLNVSSFITGLTPFKQYNFQVVASNQLGIATGALITFYGPPFVGVPGEDWTSVAASADGSVLVAVANPGNGGPGGPIYISTNSGAVWNQATNAPPGRWESVACSADGSKIITAQGGAGGSILGPIYTSTDTGATWVSNSAPVQSWQSVASSADGVKLAAADLPGHKIFTSTNAGSTWAQASNAPVLAWYSIASSADGSKLAAVANAAYFLPSPVATNIYTSTNFGATWITNTVPATPFGIQNNWTAIASSADGSRLIAAGGGYNSPGYIFDSTNFGAAWRLTATNVTPGLGHNQWIGVASSADGSKLAAVSESGLPGGVITSSDSGATWTTNAVPNLTWNAVALSADGAKLVVTVGYPSYVGPIFTTQTTPSPMLNLSAADNAISWIVPSLDFTLQQSPDLSSWTDVTNLPVLNLTNLQNQVTLPSDGTSFFRLLH